MTLMIGDTITRTACASSTRLYFSFSELLSPVTAGSALGMEEEEEEEEER